MGTRLVLAAAAGGKTHFVTEHIKAMLSAAPLSVVWVVVPDRNQAFAFQHRIAKAGAIGVRITTFGDLYAEILAELGASLPVTPEALINRLIRTSIDRTAEIEELNYYLPIKDRPGLVGILADLFAELKRGLIAPSKFSSAVTGKGTRLEELAKLYEQYQFSLQQLNWSDHEGLGWIAANTLEKNPGFAQDWPLLVVDGFDSFNPCQISVLEALAPRVQELVITLTGDATMSRLAHRKFARTYSILLEAFSPSVESLTSRVQPVHALSHIEANLFQPDTVTIPAGDAVWFIETQNPALEAREALRWLKARIVRDKVPPNECAIIARDISLYSVFLREAAREFGLPLRLACGEPLASNPAIAAIMNLLALPPRKWKRRSIIDALRSPYFDMTCFGFADSDASKIEEIARLGQVIEGIDEWHEAFLQASNKKEQETDEEDERPSSQVGRSAQAIWESMSALFGYMTPPVQEEMKGFMQWLTGMLTENGGLRLASCAESQTDTAVRDQAAITAFTKVLRALVLGETVVGHTRAITYDEFYSELRGLVDTTTYRSDEYAEDHLGSIYATDLTGARGVAYQAVTILGLSEGLFPAPIFEDPLLSDNERDALAKEGLALEPRLRSDQQTLFYEAVTRSSRYLLLTRPYLADDGENWEASPFWNATLNLLEAQVQRIRLEDRRDHVEAASIQELFAWSVRRGALPDRYKEFAPEWDGLLRRGHVLRARLRSEAGTEYDGEVPTLSDALMARYGPPYIWSPSGLETYGACPFQFFTTRALELKEHLPPEPGYDAAQLGSMLHSILEQVYRETDDPTDLECLLSTVQRIAAQVFMTAPQTYSFRPTVLWETQQNELLQSLVKTLQGLHECCAPYRPSYFELAFGTDNHAPLVLDCDEGPVLLRGVIDRVDLDEAGNMRVIDYKSGSVGLNPSDLWEGHRLQLPLYSLAAAQCHNLGNPVDGFYWAILKGEKGALQLQKFHWETEDGQTYLGIKGAMDLVIRYVGAYVHAVRAGLFLPKTPTNGCKDYCPARLFCWHYQPTQKYM